MQKLVEVNYSEPADLETIWNLPLGENDSGAATLGGYLKELLWCVWEEGESFSGKRPFGNSGWDWDLAKPLLEVKYLRGKYYIDEDGYMDIVEIDTDQYSKIIKDLINHMTVKNG